MVAGWVQPATGDWRCRCRWSGTRGLNWDTLRMAQAFGAHLKHFALPYMQFMYNEYGREGEESEWGVGG